jgi:hypothetical protein
MPVSATTADAPSPGPHDPGPQLCRRHPLRRFAAPVLAILLPAAAGLAPPRSAAAVPVSDAAAATARAAVPVRAATTPIAVDGLLSEAAWDDARAVPLAWEWYPGDNEEPPVDTVCLVTFDDDNLYVAFRAADPEPGRVRAHLADRDSAFEDDLVGFVVDPFADRRRGYRFQVNPLGVQMDALVSDVDDSTDWTWDAIWDAAGRLTPEGYTVEIAVPWKQIRFPRAGAGVEPSGADPQAPPPGTWGFLALRDYPRSVDHQLRSVPHDRDRDCDVCQFGSLSGLTGLTPGLDLEVIPTLTASRSDQRDPFPEGDLQAGDEETEAGLTARWGITPSVRLAATLNPDFSQVEADAAVLDVNTRFAIYYPEKRPFFLEGSDLYSTLLPAVFTRTVADPTWGLKLSGTEGRHAFGALLARDDVTNLVFPGYQGSDSTSLDVATTDSVLRYRRDVGRRSTLGLLYTGRDGGGYGNDVLGVDGALRLGGSDTVRFQVLGSRTEYPGDVVAELDQPAGSFDDLAWRVRYNHGERDWSWFGYYDDLGTDFRADSGFLTRVDLRQARAGVSRTVWGEDGDGYSRLVFTSNFDATEDQAGEIHEWGADIGVNYEGPWQSGVSIFYAPNQEHFDGVDYRDDRYSIGFEIQPIGGLATEIGVNWGETIDYANSRQAHFVSVYPGVAFNLGRHVEGSLEHLWERAGVDVGELYEANVSELKLYYHFDRRTYLRALVQRQAVDFNPPVWEDEIDPESRELFLQLLFSYKLNPQTVLLAGYSDDRQADSTTDLTQAGRTFFLKVGYAFLF